MHNINCNILQIDKRKNCRLKILVSFFVYLIAVFNTNPHFVYGNQQMRSEALHIVTTSDGDTERIDYVDDEGNITYAVDLHYATVLKTKNDNLVLEEYLDSSGEPVIQTLGHYALLREYNNEGQNYKVTYLGIDGNPIINLYGYSIIIRTFNSDEYVESEMYYDTKGQPIETPKLAYGCMKEYDEKGRNKCVTYLSQNHEPMMTGQGYAAIKRSYYETGELDGKIKTEFYYDQNFNPIPLSLGQYGVYKKYDDLGRENILIYLDADGTPFITNEGYASIKRTYNLDDSVASVQYYDVNGNPAFLSEGQSGYRVDDGNTIYIDSEGNDLFNLKNYLFSHQYSVIIICIIVVISSLIFDRNINIILIFFYINFILYMTLLFRTGGNNYYNPKPFWSYVQFFDNKELRWEILNNVFLFIPLGTILFRIYPKKRILFLAIALSFLIELIQLITGTGLCEIDDLISNGIGGLIGLAIGCIFFRDPIENIT